MAVDVLDHHDGVVNQDADREDQREKRHPVQRKAPGPGGEQGHGQGQDHGRANDGGLAPAQGQEHQGHHRCGGEQQLLDQLDRLVVGRRAVVAGFGHLHRRRNHGVAQFVDALHHGVGHVDGVLASLLGDAQRHGRVAGAACGLALAVPDILAGRQRAIDHVGHVTQKHRPGIVHGHHQFGGVAGLREEGAGFQCHSLVASHHLTHGQAQVRRLQGAAQVAHGHAVACHARRVQAHQHGAAGAANGADLAGAAHALEFNLDAVRHALQVVGVAGAVLLVQRERDDGHVVNALGFDDGVQHAEVARQPVGVVAQRVVQAHQGFGAGNAHLELHRHHRQPRLGQRHHMLDADHL